jgi:uncharacterized protein YndB with AHSA1/START domain
MKLVAKYDMEAPAEYVFAQIADFEGWERAAMRRGADVMRTDSLASVEPGATWSSQFRYRGKDRKVTIRLDSLALPSALALTAMSGVVDGVATVDVLDLAKKRTRLEVRLEVKPKTLAARIYVQSLRLARSRVERSFAQRVAQLTAEIEDRYRKQGR